MLGCNKSEVSRWEKNPCSTQAICKRAKLAVVVNSAKLFHLEKNETEMLANKAGLSMHQSQNEFLERVKKYSGTYSKLLRSACVSERMFQYYMLGKEPTKQALLAILISLELSLDEIKQVLQSCGYCLSLSLPNDVVVLWFLMNRRRTQNVVLLLHSINEVLEQLELPLLMTKLIHR